MPKNNVFIPKKYNRKISGILKEIIGFVKLYFGHTSKKYLFYLCSRDRDIFQKSYENVGMKLGGYFLTSQQFATYFEKQGYGNIINLASIYGVRVCSY